jgi:hypothetical protein
MIEIDPEHRRFADVYVAGFADGTCMRPMLLQTERLGSPDPLWLSAMAAIAIGMFLGNWVIGPMLNTDTPDRQRLQSATLEQMAISDASLRPDPSPYRTPTPIFNMPETNYATAAKERAQASLGWRGSASGNAAADAFQAFDEVMPEAPAPHPQFRAPRFDRHTGVRY